MHANDTSIVRAKRSRLHDAIIYDIARFIGSPFAYDVVGFEHIQTPGPAIYIANHLGALGPIEVILSVPVRFYPWAIAEMMDFDLAPRYLFDDFVRPVLHLSGRLGMAFSTLLTKISVRLLRSVGAVKIDRFGGLTMDGFRESLRLLSDGKSLLIFPEDALLPLDPESRMRPFMPGFASLCSLFQAEQPALLPVYPMAVHAGIEMIAIGKPEYFYQQSSHRQAINDFCVLIEERVRHLYLDLKHSENSIE